MHITYLEHSGFFVEGKTHCFLFDYIQGEVPIISQKPLYVFVSHVHHDHYQERIFELAKIHPDVTYILSFDIPKREVLRGFWMKEQETKQIRDVAIHTLPSTDEGVAFLIEAEGKRIYHAGDLNWWHWEEENTIQENEEAKQAYIRTIACLKNQHIDIAFVVVDPRQEDQFYYGILELCRLCTISHIIPMHLWGDYDTIQRLLQVPEMAPYRDLIVRLHHPKEEFEV